MNRRTFLQSAATLALAGAATRNAWGGATVAGGRLLSSVGLQLFSLPKLLEADFEGTLALIAGMGYRSVELYGPYPFSARSAHERWAAVTPSLGFSGSGFFGRTATEVAALLKRHQLSAPSIHTDYETLRTQMEPLAEAAHVLGSEYVVLPSIPAARRKTLDDYRRVADEFNEIGDAGRRKGVRFAYHNHGYGLKEVDGVTPLRVLLDRTDASRVWLEMDLFWTVAGGVDPAKLFAAYPNRYALVHLKDMTKSVRFSGDGGDAQQWIELFPYMTTAGDGVLDLRLIIQQAQRAGVRHFIVEQDRVDAPERALRRSFDYLAKL